MLPARSAGACQRAIQALAGPAHAEQAAEPQAQPDHDRSAAPERKRDARGVPKSGGASLCEMSVLCGPRMRGQNQHTRAMLVAEC